MDVLAFIVSSIPLSQFKDGTTFGTLVGDNKEYFPDMKVSVRFYPSIGKMIITRTLP